MQFHYLARGIIIMEGKVLLAHERGAGNTFLPGGHIETGERAEAALLRELVEELGLHGTVERFVGAVEHCWPADWRDQVELNLLFTVAVPGLDPSAPPPSCEPQLEFIWAAPDELQAHNLLPTPMIDCLTTLEAGYHGFWGTTLV